MSLSKLVFISGFIIVLLNGIWEMLGFPTFLVKVSFLTILLIASLILIINRKFQLKAFEIFFLLALIMYLLSIYVIYPNISTAVSLFQIFSPLILLILLNIISRQSIDQTFYINLIKIFIFLQLIAVGLKLLMVGQGEGLGIGTLSIQAGGLSTFIGTFMCLYALHEKYKGNFNLHVIILLAALFFIIVNEKRLGTLIVVCFSIYSALSNNKNIVNHISTRIFRFFIGISIGVIFFIVGTMMIPTILEAYSITDFDERVWDYLTATHSDGRPIGRLAGLFQTYTELIDKGKFLFGFGPESLLFSNIANSSSAIEFNPIGLTVVLSRFGMLGLLFMLLFFYYLFTLSRNNIVLKIFSCYLLLDFLIYSNSIFLSYSLIFLFSTFYNHYLINKKSSYMK